MSQDWEQKLARYAGAAPDAARRDASGYATAASAPPARTMGEVLEALVAEQQKQTALLEGTILALLAAAGARAPGPARPVRGAPWR